MIWRYPHGKAPVLHHFTLEALCLRSLSIHLWTSLHAAAKEMFTTAALSFAASGISSILLYIYMCVRRYNMCIYIYISIYYKLYIYILYNFVYVFHLFQLLFLLCVGTCDHNCNSTFLAQLIPRLRLFRLRIVHLRLHLVPRNPTAGRKSLDIDASGSFQDVLANFYNFWSRDFC